MNVEQGDFGTAVAPDKLSTMGMGPCIGAALIHNHRGFIIHAEHVIIDSKTVTDFFDLLAQYIPHQERLSVIPVLVGGSLEVDEPNEEPGCRTIDCRNEIVRMFGATGFGDPIMRWCNPHEIHSLHMDFIRVSILLEIINLQNGKIDLLRLL